MAFDYINEAFKRLDTLEEDIFNTSSDGISKLNDFVEEDDEVDSSVRVIDPNAADETALEDSYVGKVIINCNVCHSHIFENKDEITIDEDGAVNVEMQCPYCGETEGFVIIGEIAPYDNEPAEESPVDNTEEESKEIFSSGDFDEYKEEEKLEESLGLGLALGGAAIGAGMVGSKLLDSVEDNNDDEVLTEKKDCEEALLNLNIDGSNSSVGFLGGTASTTNEDIDERNQCLRMSRASKRASMTEDFKEVSIKTEDQKLEMSSDENGKVTVTTEPIESESTTEAEMIVPVSDETESDILANNAEESTEEFEDTDFDFDEIDEEGLDELGEGYLRRVYENVESFKTTSAAANETALIVEGLIKFNSGVEKKTGFIFEAKDVNTKGQLRFCGHNKHLSESNDAFSLVGRIDNKKLIVESLKYNYKVNEDSVRGVIRRK